MGAKRINSFLQIAGVFRTGYSLRKRAKCFFAELKTIKGRLSSLQEIQIKKLKALKQEVYVIYGMEGVRKFVEDFQNNCLSGTEYR